MYTTCLDCILNFGSRREHTVKFILIENDIPSVQWHKPVVMATTITAVTNNTKWIADEHIRILFAFISTIIIIALLCLLLLFNTLKMAWTLRHLHNPFETSSRHDDTQGHANYEFVYIQSGCHESFNLVVVSPPLHYNPIYFFYSPPSIPRLLLRINSPHMEIL